MIIQIISDVKEDWSEYWPLDYAASYWPPTKLCATGCYPLALTIGATFQSTQPAHTLAA